MVNISSRHDQPTRVGHADSDLDHIAGANSGRVDFQRRVGERGITQSKAEGQRDWLLEITVCNTGIVKILAR